MKKATEIKEKREMAETLGGKGSKYVKCECGYTCIAKNKTFFCNECKNKVVVID